MMNDRLKLVPASRMNVFWSGNTRNVSLEWCGCPLRSVELAGGCVGKVAIENIETGMVLASDVLDRSGRMLLGAGAELTHKHLVIFRTWGVLEADIAGQGNDETVEQI